MRDAPNWNPPPEVAPANPNLHWGAGWEECDPPIHVPKLKIEWAKNRRMALYACKVRGPHPKTGHPFEITLHYPRYVLRQAAFLERIQDDFMAAAEGME